MGNNVKTQKPNLIKIVIFSIVLIVVLVYITIEIFKLVKNPTDTFMIENGNLYLEENVEGYILREEVIVQGENYKSGIVKIKEEGEKVAKSDPVFRHKSTREDELLEKIEELNVKIEEALKNEKIDFPSDINLLENQIQEKINNINGLNNFQKISALKKEINEFILKKAKIIGELSPSGSYIKKLIEERSSYENELNSNSEYITAPISGIVSYKVDGYEDFFGSKNIEYLSRELLENFEIRAGQLIESSNEKAKVINNYVCYIAVIMNSEEAKKAKLGDKVALEFLNLDEVTAIVEKIFEEETGTRVIVFRINDYIENLVEYRKINLNLIWWSKNGLKVPNSAIITEEDKNYIIKNRAGYKEKVLIKVLKQNQNYTIIDNYSTEELKDLGYSTQEINKLKKIVIYDQIFIK